MNFRKINLPKVEATPTSMFTWAGYLVVLTIIAAVVAAVLKLVVGFMALGVIVCAIAGIVLTISSKFTAT